MALLLFKNEYIEISREAGQFFVKSKAKGLSLEAFNKILREHFPNVKITSFLALKNVLTRAPYGPEPFGEERERITISMTDDALKAYITLYVSDDDLSPNKRVELVKEVLEALSKAGIVYGIKTNVLAGPLRSGIEYLIAEGLPAVNGTDAVIKTYEISTPQPKISDQGRVDHYELNLIHRVAKGDWLGQRKDPTPGIPGKNVKGKEIPPIPGKSLPLLYDRPSVYEEYRDGITYLFSKKNGAVYYKGETIGVYDFLENQGDINFSTGNIDFDGFLSVKGTVADNFCVSANKDIEILGEYGVGAADSIISQDGSIFIKGGIAGKGKTMVRCKKNLYVKFLSDIDVECEGTVYVGYYCMNTNIRAKQVIVESPKGRIIGGSIDADLKVSVAELGNRAESRTIIRIRGFDRASMKRDLDSALAKLEESKNQLVRIKQHIQVYTCATGLSAEQKASYENLRNQYSDIKDEVKKLEFHVKSLSEYLKTPGEGAVLIKNRCYPKVRIEIKGLSEEISKETPVTSYYYRDNEIKTI